MTRTTLSRSKPVAAKARTTPAQAATDSVASHPTFAELAQTCRIKPTRLLALKSTATGAVALLEFEGGFQREVRFVSAADALHPLVANLDWPARHKLRDAVARREVLPDGNVRVYDVAFPHAAEVRTKRGGWVRKEPLLTTSTNYKDADVEAARILRALCGVAADAGPDNLPSGLALRNALMALGHGTTEVDRSVRMQLANKLTSIVEAYLKSHDWRPWADRVVTDAEASRDALHADERREVQERVARMVAARRAKRAAKAAVTTQAEA